MNGVKVHAKKGEWIKNRKKIKKGLMKFFCSVKKINFVAESRKKKISAAADLKLKAKSLNNT